MLMLIKYIVQFGLKMLLDRNIFVLLLLAYVNGGRQNQSSDEEKVPGPSSVNHEIERNLNFLHEVYVFKKDHPEDKPVIGCIINGGLEVVVPKSSNPSENVLRIRYRDEDGEVRETKVDGYQETNSASLLVLTPHTPIPMSNYAKQADIIFKNLIENFKIRSQTPIFGTVKDANGKMFSILIGNKLQTESDYGSQSYHLKVVSINGTHLPKGATILLASTNVMLYGYGSPIVAGMYEKNENGIIYFNIFDREKLQYSTESKPAAIDGTT